LVNFNPEIYQNSALTLCGINFCRTRLNFSCFNHYFKKLKLMFIFFLLFIFGIIFIQNSCHFLRLAYILL